MIRNRYRKITTFFTKIIINLIIWDIFLPLIGLKRISSRTRSSRLRKIAIKFRVLATEMGGVMIKVGQFLSTRVDVLPEEITNELANLQDEVYPETFTDIRGIAEEELGSPLEDLYKYFHSVPLASASLGQVHEAVLREPDQGIKHVVVKVQRPHIKEIIKTDLSALVTVGKWLNKYKPISKRANINALLREFSKITFEEIDYIAEGKNAEIFYSRFNGAEIRIPLVVWKYTTKRVLTLENVQGIKITNYDAIANAGINRKEVAQRLFELYLQQIFEDGFFHADPHPGNLFVQVGNNNSHPDDLLDYPLHWTLNIVDFGMVGKIPPNVQAGLRELAIGIGTQDTSRLIHSYQMLDVLLPDANLALIQEADKQIFKAFYGKTMSELSQVSWDEIHEIAKEFRELILDMPFQIPSNLIFLGRCVAILSGMCTGLDPEFNVWDGLLPLAKKIIREEALHGWNFWREEIGEWGKILSGIPRKFYSVLEKVETSKLEVDTPQLNLHAANLERTGRRVISAVIFAVLFFSGVQFYLSEYLYIGIGLIIIAMIPLLHIIFTRK